MSRLTEELAEENQSLLRLAASPMIWAAHFLLSYITAAIWCAKVAGPDGPLGVVRVAIAMYTVLALSGIGVIGWSAFRRHSYGAAPPARRRHAGGSAPLPGVCHPAAVGPERGSDPVRGPRRRLHRELLLMRRALLVCGLLTLAAVWLGPLPQLARQAFWAHMTLHMGVVAVAPPSSPWGSPVDDSIRCATPPGCLLRFRPLSWNSSWCGPGTRRPCTMRRGMARQG